MKNVNPGTQLPLLENLDLREVWGKVEMYYLPVVVKLGQTPF